MGTVTTTDVQNGTTTDANTINNNFTNVKTQVNGNLDNSNISASAAIALSKLAHSGIAAGTSVISNGTNWVAGAVPPSGSVIDFAGSAAPTGWLLCDGSAVSRATYAALFAVVSTTYGAGDGSTTFNLPDCRGRMTVGLGTNTDIDALGENDGAALGDRRPKHKHTVSEPSAGSHSHTGNTGIDSTDHFHVYDRTVLSGGNVLQFGGDIQSVATASANTTTENTNHTHTISSDGAHTHGTTVGPQTTVPTDAPSYIVFNKIIKT